jgi:hypothetical protein
MALLVLIGTASCGTILYPERRGQAVGRIDVGVAVLDGIGLLFFLVPGVIAFAVDFATGAIYLPPDSVRLELDLSDLQDMEIVQTDRKSLTRQEIEAVVAQKTGQAIDLASPRVRVARISYGHDPAWGSIAVMLTPNRLVAFENKRLKATLDSTP